MTIIRVGNFLGIRGNDIVFENKDFFDLKVGEQIIQVGDGRENGCWRTDTFKYPLEYVGSINLQFSKLELWFAFLLPDKLDNENVYLIYSRTNEEIFADCYYSTDRQTKKASSYIRFYVPTFTRFINKPF